MGEPAGYNISDSVPVDGILSFAEIPRDSGEKLRLEATCREYFVGKL